RADASPASAPSPRPASASRRLTAPSGGGVDSDMTGPPSAAGGQQPAGHLAEADAVAGALAPRPERHPVAVLQEGAALAVAQVERFGAAPGQLQQAAVGVRRRAADRARGQQVARAQVA